MGLNEGDSDQCAAPVYSSVPNSVAGAQSDLRKGERESYRNRASERVKCGKAQESLFMAEHRRLCDPRHITASAMDRNKNLWENHIFSDCHSNKLLIPY